MHSSFTPWCPACLDERLNEGDVLLSCECCSEQRYPQGFHTKSLCHDFFFSFKSYFNIIQVLYYQSFIYSPKALP